jgi:hypothetical protein
MLKRREDAVALRKLRETEGRPHRILHEALWECEASSHRFLNALTSLYSELHDDEAGAP